jgi:hypothetical protein
MKNVCHRPLCTLTFCIYKYYCSPENKTQSHYLITIFLDIKML